MVSKMHRIRKPKPEIPLAKGKAEFFMMENFASLMGKLNTRFGFENESSAQSTTDESHILYYRAFMSSFIEIAPDVFVSTENWALVFIQEDLSSTARELCKCIHSTDLELRRRLIQKIAAWMMEKYTRKLDPWSWSCSEEFQSSTPTLTQEQISIINKEIDRFEHRDCCEPVYPLFQDIFDNICSTLSIDQLESTLDKLPGGDIYDNAFHGFAKCLKDSGNEINLAHITTALTKCTISFNTDIFFDAVQISNNRVTDAAALAGSGFSAVAFKLCKQIIVRDFIQQNKQFGDVHNICPVKRLAIYRAVKFLVSIRFGWITARTCDFNSEIEDHNVYPTIQEREQIDHGIRGIAAEVFADARRKLGDDVVDSFTTPTIHVSSPGTNELDQINAQELPTFHSSLEQEIVSWLTHDLSSSTNASTSMLQPGLNPGSDFFVPMVPTAQQTPEPLYFYANSGPSNFDNITVNVANNTLPFLPLIDNSFAATPVTPMEDKYAPYLIPNTVLYQAQREFENPGRISGTIRAGKYFFQELLTPEQKLTCTWGGKKNTPKYPLEIVNAIYDALAKFEKDAGKERTSREVIKTQVFVDTGNQLRNPKPKPKKNGERIVYNGKIPNEKSN